MSITPSFKKEIGQHLTSVLFDEPLKNYVAYQIGGPADVLVFPKDEAELSWLNVFCTSHGVSITVLGTGTNLLVHDLGIRGVVVILKDSFNSIEILSQSSAGIWVRCGGGVRKPTLLDWACKNGFSGLEFSSGVPGTIGGGIFMNAGTKYGSYGDILEELRIFRFKEGFKTLKRGDFTFSYRSQDAVIGALVIWAVFKVVVGDPQAIRIEINRIIAERAKKQPLDFPSCGSTFKNPVGYSAGRLIEKAGLKGLRIGGAEISEKHANFILNKGNATAGDVMACIQIAQRVVRERFNIVLETEVISLGGLK